MDDKMPVIVAAFQRLVPDDNIPGPMYPNADFAEAEARLRRFLIFGLLDLRTNWKNEATQNFGLAMLHSP